MNRGPFALLGSALIALLAVIAGPASAQTPDNDTRRITIGGDAGGETTTSIPRGWSVEWYNADSGPHTIIVNLDGDEFSLGEVAPGESLTLGFDDEGTFTYVSENDPDVYGTITVGTPTPTDSSPTATAPTATVPVVPSVVAPVPSAGPVTVVTPTSAPTQAAETATPAPSPAVEITPAEAGPDDRPEAPDSGSGLAPSGAFEFTAAFLAAAVAVIALSNLLWSASKGAITIERGERADKTRKSD